jgi:hypothetical protein
MREGYGLAKIGVHQVGHGKLSSLVVSKLVKSKTKKADCLVGPVVAVIRPQ